MGGGNNLRNDMLCTTFDPSTNRTSAGADWIRSQTCIFAGDLLPSQSLPSYLNCGPLPTPFLPPAGIVPVLIYIVLDSDAEELWWDLVDITLTQSNEIMTRRTGDVRFRR
jgi:hypothetical protein